MGTENENFDMDSALESISSELGFDGVDDSSESLDSAGSLDGGGSSEPTPAPVSGESVQTPPAPAVASTTDQSTTPAAVTPPRTWRPEAAAHWANLPLEVQQEIAKREEDIFKGIEGYKADAHYGKTMQSVVAPYARVMEQYSINPVEQISGLLNAHYTLALGTPEAKAELMRSLFSDYNIDPSTVIGSGQGTAQNAYVDPEVIALRKELAEVKSLTNGIQTERLAQQRQSINAEVDKFFADPANVYAKDLVNDMIQLLNTNQAGTVKDAYEKAMWLNPAVRAKEIARQQTEQSAAAAKEAEAKAAAARKATAANVRSSAKRGGAATPTGSMDDTLAETLAAIQSRG